MAGRVLLIEDEVNIAEAIRFLLTRDGCEGEVLADGHAAVAAVARALPDLVILDLMLPGMSGLEILSALRADPVTVAVPVLMLTAKGQGRDREAAERAGVSAFMSKPFANAEMRATVRALLGACDAAVARAAVSGPCGLSQKAVARCGAIVAAAGILSADFADAVAKAGGTGAGCGLYLCGLGRIDCGGGAAGTGAWRVRGRTR